MVGQVLTYGLGVQHLRLQEKLEYTTAVSSVFFFDAAIFKLPSLIFLKAYFNLIDFISNSI